MSIQRAKCIGVVDGAMFILEGGETVTLAGVKMRRAWASYGSAMRTVLQRLVRPRDPLRASGPRQVWLSCCLCRQPGPYCKSRNRLVITVMYLILSLSRRFWRAPNRFAFDLTTVVMGPYATMILST